jgi:tetratricopeptide (TPR) repeat protein
VGNNPVSKRPKHPPPRQTEGQLRARIDRAQQEGRFQQALELAKSLYKQDPSGPHRELLQQMTLGRARQLRGQGHLRDAVTVLENAVALDASLGWREQLAGELAAAGNVASALDLLRPYSESAALPRVLTRAADAALSQGKAGRALLPEALQGPFDLVLQAFAQAEVGQDEAARASLQGIGLQSPFLEWKLLLRGLLAYYQGDDVRALENWQRLDADRLPARLAAPLRFTIDPAFRLAQPPATQTSLRQQADRLQSSGLVQPLRAIQSALAHEHQLSQAFRLAETHLAALRQEAPQLVPRLASCFYWTIIHGGRPEDLPRYRRVFGEPADDPQLARLEALALDHRHELAESHKEWQKFEKEIAGLPSVWPGEQAARARALIWHHMGTNAAEMPDKEELAQLPPFLRNQFDRPRPLNPSAEKCFERSLGLAPDRVETYEALLDYWRRKDRPAEVLKVGRRLLDKFPDHVPTLEALGDLELEQDNPAEGLRLLQAALRHNPLDRGLRGKVSYAHMLNARRHVDAGEFDTARQEYRAALALGEGKKDASILCKWAACEFKAGDAARAEELLGEALNQGDTRLEVAYSMVIEGIRMKLRPALKTRFNKEFKALLAEPPTSAAAVRAAQVAGSHRLSGVRYHGQKTHEKQVLGFVEKALRSEFSEGELVGLCASLSALDARKLHLQAIKLGQKKFPSSPVFYIAEAQHNVTLGPHRCPPWETRELLRKAQDLTTATPANPQREQLLEVIKELQKLVSSLNPFGGLLGGGMLGGAPDDFFGEEDEDVADFDW